MRSTFYSVGEIIKKQGKRGFMIQDDLKDFIPEKFRELKDYLDNQTLLRFIKTCTGLSKDELGNRIDSAIRDELRAKRGMEQW